MPKPKKEHQDKVIGVTFYPIRKEVTELTESVCKKLAKDAVSKAYLKQIKSK